MDAFSCINLITQAFILCLIIVCIIHGGIDPEILCDITGFCIMLFYTSYFILLVPFTLSRYYPICRGLEFTYKDGAIPVFLAFILLIVNFVTPLFFGLHYVPSAGGVYCINPWYEKRIQFLIPTVVSLTIWIITFCIMVCAYYQ
jgi:hypothetical protein